MLRFGLSTFAITFGTLAAVGLNATPLSAQAKQWANLNGQVIWDGDVPKQAPINVGANNNVCAKDPKPLEEDYIVNPKNKGLKNAFVWIAPSGAAKGAPFPVAAIHPRLIKPATPEVDIDQPCCRFIPHVLATREGQKLTIKNSAPIAHNAKFESDKNGVFNVLIPAGGKFELPKALVAESIVITLNCNIHPWMSAYIRVFDHPYFAITDEDGKFEIKMAPVGKYNIFVHHNSNGWLDGAAGRKGKALDIQPGNMNLGEFKMKRNP